jgi:hypothetical protein
MAAKPAPKASGKPLPVKKAGAGKAGLSKGKAAVWPVVAKARTAKTVAAKPAASRSQAAARPTARSVAVTKSIAVKPAAKRRPTRKPASAPVRARPAAAAKPQQTFTVSHLNEADFKPDGLRPYALYRDLGIAAASAGLCQAHVIRFVPPTTDEVRKRHTHSVDLQLVYVLKGWMKNEFEGVGEQMMSTGSCWLQPSGVRHTVLDYSADCEVLEIVVPADFKTQELS